jgi:hypothetical protein
MTAETTPILWPPPAQMGALDFLGHHRCVGPAPADGAPPTVTYMHGEPTLRRHYCALDFARLGVTIGRWIFAWNPLEGEYNVSYPANSGARRRGVSRGRAGGELDITGEYSVVERNARKTVRDVFSWPGENGCFVTRIYVRSEAVDRWILLDVYDVQPISADQARKENSDARH